MLHDRDVARMVRWWSVMLVMATLSVAVPALAAVNVPTPAGWNGDIEVGPEARALAEGWAHDLSGEVIAVRSTRGEDDHLEVIAAVRQADAVDARRLANEDQAVQQVREAVAPLFDSSGPVAESEMLDVDGVVAVRARWANDGQVWDIVLVPEGTHRVIVVMKARADEMVFYDATFREVVRGLGGAEAPVEPLPRNRWRLYGSLLLLVLGGGLLGVAVATADVRGDLESAGRRAALWQVVASVVVFVGAFVLLNQRADQVTATGASVAVVAGELLIVGLAVAGLLLLVSRLLDSGPQRIQSAPDVGTFRQGHAGTHDSVDDAAVPQQVKDLPPQ